MRGAVRSKAMTGRLPLWALMCLPGLFGQLLSKERDYQIAKLENQVMESIRIPIMSLTESILQTQMDQCDRAINLLQNKMVEMEERLQVQETREINSRIGFYTYITFETTDAILKFDRVIFNEGNAYNSSTGSFTCQVPGTYHFVWSVQIQNTDWGHVLVDFQLNGNTKGFTITFGPKEHTSTNSIIIRLEQGDRVWLQKRSMNQIKIAAYETSFSGHFLFY
ncbi:complement C1q subcomponent subunit C-like [Mizuhopecten yessoensis]|uniref:Complement C1q tumor necrosis factor-related protein 5 n=1 Tax=Mizuhopecten yessoensis TaxID=6573 RepID=A0A210QQK9_MIZYE|nr:complement C1q subcomponent subunit C-like [Mizuhopecten yessoensis]OWF51026.1 Complement C1q tumor necrosis factor-related protein 5 [Mizuhopecten yessoensis]